MYFEIKQTLIDSKNVKNILNDLNGKYLTSLFYIGTPKSK